MMGTGEAAPWEGSEGSKPLSVPSVLPRALRGGKVGPEWKQRGFPGAPWVP